MEQKSLIVQLNTYKVAIIGLLVFSFGLLGFWSVGSIEAIKENTFWKSFIENCSGALLSTGLLGTVFDLVARRSFLAEVRSISKVADSASKSGLLAITVDFGKEIDWDEELGKTGNLDLLVTYARTWRNIHRGALEKLARRKGARIRIVLPNPENDRLMSTLDARFSQNPGTLKGLIEDAVKDFGCIFKGADEYQLYYTNVELVFSVYRFDDVSILATFAHGPKGSDVPTLLIDKNGTLANFVNQQFDFILEEESKRVEPQITQESELK